LSLHSRLFSKRFFQSIAPFGFRHELAKRYTPLDWYKSRKVRKLINSQDSDELISDLILTSSVGLVGRLGGTEGRFIGEYLKLKRLQKFGIPIQISSSLSRRWKRRKSEVYLQAGFYFQEWADVEKFCCEYLNALKQTDILGAWGVAFTCVEGIGLDKEKTAVIPVGFTAPWVEPYVPEKVAWANSLEGKRVLVVSGFADSISKQHPKISSIYRGVSYPDFELRVVKAPLAAGNADVNGKSWFELLDETKRQIADEEFDVALIAAGAFSYPLAAYVKSLGKIGIHCGGGLQLFFGIMGNRWNNSPEVLRYVNEDWVRPSKAETPKMAEKIENACYW